MASTDTARGTGRTTRMIEHAKQLASEGRAVYIIAAHDAQASDLKKRLVGYPGIKVEPRAPDGFDWQRMWVAGAHSNCVFLVDHYAIESRFWDTLEMLHRYDKP